MHITKITDFVRIVENLKKKMKILNKQQQLPRSVQRSCAYNQLPSQWVG